MPPKSSKKRRLEGDPKFKVDIIRDGSPPIPHAYPGASAGPSSYSRTIFYEGNLRNDYRPSFSTEVDIPSSPATLIPIDWDNEVYDSVDFVEFAGRDEAEVTENVEEESTEGKPTLKHGRQRKRQLDEWMPRRPEYLDELVRLDGRAKASPTCTRCSADGGHFRCCECHESPILCPDCIKAVHKYVPLHRVEKWNGIFWEKFSLRSLGLEVNLGHFGELCAAPMEIVPLVVVDVNGLHIVDVVYCGCNSETGGQNIFKQLMRARWYPATTQKPSTVFTFATLDFFHELTVQGKTSAHDYYQALAHLTDNAGVTGFPKRYDEFCRVARCYRHLILAKRAGRAHDPQGIEKTADGQLALDCPSCPHPGKNLPPNWKESRLWIHRLMLAMDANFRLKMKERYVEGDSALGPGWAYFVNPGPYYEQLGQQDKKDIHKIEKDSCGSTFQALEKATVRVNDGYRVTGVGAVICARSGMLRKNGAGDLQKGERYVNMDYIFLSSILGCLGVMMLVSYDIACQWHKNLSRRVKEYPLALNAAFFEFVLTVMVPKYHLKAHGEKCQTPYNPNLLPHTARTDGEAIERQWSQINPIAMSTREMGPGLRLDTIDDHWSAYNWRKIVGHATSLLKKFEDAVKLHARHSKLSREYTEKYPPEVLSKWREMVSKWKENPLHAKDPYADPENHVTLAMLRAELAREEAKSVNNGVLPVKSNTASQFLIKGVELDDLRRDYIILVESKKKRPHTVSDAVMEEQKTVLLGKLKAFRILQFNFMPSVASQLAQYEQREHSEGALRDLPPIYLPSQMSAAFREALPRRFGLVEKEVRIQIARARDSIDEVCRLLRLKAGGLEFKKANATGQRDSSRARTVINNFELKILRAAERYRAARAAIRSLDPARKELEELKELRRQDVRGVGDDEDEVHRKKKSKSHRNAVQSERNFEASWIWRRKRPNEGEELAVQDAGLRAQWAKQEARVDRWTEEKLLVVEEMRRTLEYFDWKAKWWEEQAEARIEEQTIARVDGYENENENGARSRANYIDDTLASALRAYAAKQASMWREMGKTAAKKWYVSLTSRQIPVEWAQHHVDAALPDPFSLLHQAKTRERTFLRLEARTRAPSSLAGPARRALMSWSTEPALVRGAGLDELGAFEGGRGSLPFETSLRMTAPSYVLSGGMPRLAILASLRNSSADVESDLEDDEEDATLDDELK